MKAGGTALWIGLLPVLLMAGRPAGAQGLMVRPMIVNGSGQAGQTVRTIVEIRNTGGGKDESARARLRPLSQNTQGQWTWEEKPDPTKQDERSCLPWLELGKEELSISPTEPFKLELIFHVPQRARGAYYAALLMQTVPPKASGLTIAFQFLVPIFFNVQGPPANQAVALGVPALALVERKAGQPAENVLQVGFVNSGQTIEEVSGSAVLWYQKDTKWRKVTSVDYVPQSILPGHTVVRNGALGKSLPKGHYKVSCAIRVGGALKSRVEQEFDFEGAPGVSEAECDIDLLVAPSELVLKAQPGARMGVPLKIQNTGDEPVEVTLGTQMPRGLAQVMLDDLKGDQLACNGWLKISPTQFTLPARGTRSIRVDSEWPATDLLPVHYAEIVVRASYGSGSTAGQTVVPVQVRHKTAKVEPKAHGQGLQAKLATTGECLVAAQFFNVGLTEWSGKATLRLTTMEGMAVLEAPMEVDNTIVLPLGKIQCNGSLDLAKVKPGNYLAIADLLYAERHEQQSVVLAVSVVDGKKTVAVVSPKTPDGTPTAGGKG